MASSITLSEVIDRLTTLSAAIRPDDFIYDFLTCFGTPQATITRLKSGATNAAKQEGCTLLKAKVFFDPRPGNPAAAVEAAKKDAKVTAQKPRFLIATDFKTLAAYDTKRQEALEIPIADLHENYAFFLPLAGMEKAVFQAESEADVKAAEHMAKLYDLIRVDNPPETKEERHALNVFLTRLLFCYFAEDTGIFPEKSFVKAIAEYTQEDGSDVAEFLRELFLALNTENRKKTKPHLAAFPYVNGGLFSDTDTRHSAVPTFTPRSRQKLIELGKKDWKEINPDIFGSMFQGVVDDEKRAELGMHYTSVPNIMKVIQPLFLDELYEEFEKAKGSREKLNKLLKRIYHLRIFDPACGSGNFLIIAYKELRRLETAIFQELIRLGEGALFSASGIQVSQFYGIELDDFAHEVAILALWLAEHQMNVQFQKDFNKTPPALPLRVGAKVVCKNALRVDWGSVCPKEGAEVFVMGNPPYLGARMQDEGQKADMAEVFKGIEGYNNLDYIACWFFKAARYVKGASASCAFVTTNSVCQGEQVAMLWPHIFALGVEISFAHLSFKWTNNAKGNAGVTCAIIGIQEGPVAKKTIYAGQVSKQAKNINAYLVDAKNVFVDKVSKQISNGPQMGIGNKPIDDGNYTLTSEQKEELIASEQQARPYIFKWLGSSEFFKGTPRFCVLPQRIPEEKLSKMPRVQGMVERVKQFRLKSSSKPTRDFAARPTEFHVENFPTGYYFAIPKVSSERRLYIPVAYLPPTTICSDLMNVIQSSDMVVFSLTSSQMHMAWTRAVAGRLEERIRYSSTIVYNNFPFPEITPTQRKLLDQSAEKVLLTREHYPSKTIAQLYDPDTMPADLLAAHRALDLAVEQCYRAKPFTSDEERLEYLFTLYEQMTAAEKVDLFSVEVAMGKKRGGKK